MTSQVILDKNAVKLIKQVVSAAAKLREESFKPGGPDLLTDPGSYTIELEEACLRVCKAEGVHHLLAPFVWLALSGQWNDVLAWAEGEYDSSFDEDGNFVEVAIDEALSD